MSASMLARVRPDLLALQGYSSARMEAGGGGTMLNANESPWPSAADAGGALNRYPDPQPLGLRAALARLYEVPVENLLIGRGSDECIDVLTRMFCRAGIDHVLVSPPTFGMYAVCAEVQGARVVRVPLDAARGFALPHAALLRSCDEGTRLIHVCAPNNPTGAPVDPDEVLALAHAVAGRALVVVDEAYQEFADARSLAPDAARTPNLAVLRTLSKAHALAGARIGALVADAELVALARRVLAPYPLARPCIAAAEAALAPEALAQTRARIATIRSERARLARLLLRSPRVLHVHPSQANFLTVQLGSAREAYSALLARGIVVRDVSHHDGLSDCLRITIGSPDQNDALIEALGSRSVAA